MADEAAATLIFLSFLGLIFSYRRWRDLRVEVAARQRSEESLQRLRGELEDQVQFRTRELRESEARNWELFDRSPLPNWLYDDETLRFLEVNQAAIEHYGYTREEFLGMTLEDIRPPEEVPRLIALDRSAKPSSWRAGLWKHRKKDGTVIDVDVHTRRVSAGRRSTWLAVLQDVTDQRRLEEQFRQSQKMEAVGQLAGGIAHDFNNLLTAILGYSELVADQLGPESPFRGDVEEIRRAGERAAGLTRQLLAFSRKQILEPHVLDLNELVGGVEKMLGRLIGEDIALASALAPDLRPVLADPGQIEQVIMNLAVNARDAMPRGGRITIETSNVELDEAYADQHAGVTPGPYVMLAVSDTGIGMDEATRAHMFEPFFTTKERGKGTGLGLATVYGIVKQSGGHIWVYSEPGKGTTFKIYLPPTRESSDAPLSAKVEAPTRGTETILLVEDEGSVRKLARTILENHGYTVLEAGEGIEALTLAQNHPGPIHLVLTDVVMPDLGGADLVVRLQNLRPEIRMLFMSGYTDDAVIRHGLLAGSQIFVQKPFTPGALTRKVREALS